MNNAVAMYASIQAAGVEERIMQHAPLVKRIAHHLANRLPARFRPD